MFVSALLWLSGKLRKRDKSFYMMLIIRGDVVVYGGSQGYFRYITNYSFSIKVCVQI